MIRIRLAKFGSKKNKFYRIVVIDSRKKREGRAIDFLGYLFPKKNLKKINLEKLNKWIKIGATTSEAVQKLLETKSK